MRTLFNMKWTNNWENYILYGTPQKPIVIGRGDLLDVMNICDISIMHVMHQLKNSGLSVYEAYLKSVEASYCSLSEKERKKILLSFKKKEQKLIRSKFQMDEIDSKITHDISSMLYRSLYQYYKN